MWQNCRFFCNFALTKKKTKMLIYNTTYQVTVDQARTFCVWLHEQYIPRAQESDEVRNPRMCHILSHRDADSECFSLQFEVESSARLHHWFKHVGSALNEEMLRIFGDAVTGFPTMMEVIE